MGARRCIATISTICAGLAGCLPIAPAHKYVSVPALEIEIRQSQPRTTHIEIIQPKFWAENKTFIEILNDVPASMRHQRASQSITFVGEPARVVFPEEQRYIAVPAISLLPDDPNEGRHHTLFIRMGGDDDLHRVSVDGNAAKADTTSISAARQRMPGILREPEPPANSADRKWVAWFRAETSFYRSVEWRNSSQLKVLQLKRTSGSDVLTLQVGGEK